MERVERFGLIASVLVMFSMTPHAHAEVTIVVSTHNPLTALTTEQATHIFLGKSTRFPDGSPAVPLDLPEGSEARDAFYLKLVGKSPVMMKAYWAKMIFTGKGKPPQSATDSISARQLIANNPAYIGYLAEADLDHHVKVIPLSELTRTPDFE